MLLPQSKRLERALANEGAGGDGAERAQRLILAAASADVLMQALAVAALTLKP